MFDEIGVKSPMTFALMGRLSTSRLRFSRLPENDGPPFLAHLIMHLFRTCCEKFTLRSRKVMLPGHVK